MHYHQWTVGVVDRSAQSIALTPSDKRAAEAHARYFRTETDRCVSEKVNRYGRAQPRPSTLSMTQCGPPLTIDEVHTTPVIC